MRNYTWPPELNERHEVHPLVLRLPQQRVYPPVVPPHPPQRVEVPDHGGGEPRHPGHRLQQDAAREDRRLVARRPGAVVAGGEVECPAQRRHRGQGGPVGECARRAVGHLHALRLLPRPDRVLEAALHVLALRKVISVNSFGSPH